MAYTPPTVASDPASAAHTNTALASVRAFLVTAYSDISAAVATLREWAKIVGGEPESLDPVIVAMNSPSIAAPTVAADPASQAETNTALASLTGYYDTLNSRVATAIGLLRDIHRRCIGTALPRIFIDAQTPALAVATTTITVASDPVTQAHMNTALATATADVDTINTRIVNILQCFTEAVLARPGTDEMIRRLRGNIERIAAH